MLRSPQNLKPPPLEAKSLLLVTTLGWIDRIRVYSLNPLGRVYSILLASATTWVEISKGRKAREAEERKLTEKARNTLTPCIRLRFPLV